MAKKRNFNQKLCPPCGSLQAMDAIEKWAADEFRSTNGQLQWIIAEALRKSGRMKKSKNPPPSEEKAKED